MKLAVKFLLGATLLAGSTGLALAHMDGPPPPDGPMQGLVHRERLADRLLREFDTNHDGKITRAEFNSALGARFAAATHGKPAMTLDQFAAMHQGDFQQHATEMFRRIDWNGDGKLSLDEFTAPQRAHFQMMDREGTGTVQCNPVMHADYRPAQPPRGVEGVPHGSHGRGFGGFGRSSFCRDSDVSRDGTVTRAEFDGIMAKHFQQASGGAPAMTLAQFTADMSTRYRDLNERMFRRLDKDGNGTLTLAEFAAPPLKLFQRLDRDNDGTIAPDEMKPRFQRHHDSGPERGGEREPSPPEAE